MKPDRVALTVDRGLTQATQPGHPQRFSVVRLWRPQLPEGEPCYSAALHGPSLLRYDPTHPVGDRHSLALVTAGSHQVEALTREAALAALAELERGRPAYIHVNSHRAGADRRHGTISPIIAVRAGRWGRPSYVYAVALYGRSWLLCCPERPLCGAKVYLVVPGSTRLRLIGHPPTIRNPPHEP